MRAKGMEPSRRPAIVEPQRQELRAWMNFEANSKMLSI